MFSLHLICMHQILLLCCLSGAGLAFQRISLAFLGRFVVVNKKHMLCFGIYSGLGMSALH